MMDIIEYAKSIGYELMPYQIAFLESFEKARKEDKILSLHLMRSGRYQCMKTIEGYLKEMEEKCKE